MLRPRLHAALDDAARRRLTVVSAPAGSGKTVLLAKWARRNPTPTGWLSLDDPHRPDVPWWELVASALGPLLGGDLPARQDAVHERLARQQSPVVLVIDDAHALGDERPLASLLELPAMLRVVIATRHDLDVPVHRLRLIDQLAEVRQDTLAFDLHETAQLLALGGLSLSDEQNALLHRRTEGWAAGLRMAAIALADASPDQVDRRVREFAGDDHAVADYLAFEVLNRLDARARDALLRGSIVERMCGPLLDALTGRSDGTAILADLHQRNAFVVALDRQRRWYRMHRLLHDLVVAHRRAELAGREQLLHQRAAAWYVDDGRPLRAAHHAAAAEDWDLVGELLDRHAASAVADGRMHEVRAIVRQVPADVRTRNPMLAALVLSLREEDPGQAAVLDMAMDDAPVIAAITRIYRSADADQMHSALTQAERVLPPNGPGPLRMISLTTLAAARYWTTDGDPEMPLSEAASLGCALEMFDMLGYVNGLRALIATDAGRLRDAHDLATQATDAATPSDSRLIAPAHLALCLVDLDRDDLTGAAAHAENAQAALPVDQRLPLHALNLLAQARLLHASGRHDDAVDLLAAIAQWPRITRSASLLHARALIALGDVDRARAHLGGVPDGLDVGVVRALCDLAGGDPRSADRTLQRPRRAGLAARVESHVLRAAIAYADSRAERAAGQLEKALDLAEPEGLRRPFAEHADRLTGLLAEHAPITAHRAFVDGLLDGVGDDACVGAVAGLSPRELAVLRHLPTELTAAEIAQALFVSTNTIRTHIRHIYDKLDVHTRSEAVRAARELGLLAPPRLPTAL